MTRKYSFTILILCAMAFAIFAGTASAQTIVAGTTTINFTYAKGATTATQTSAISDSGSGNTYTVSPAYNGASGSYAWLTTTGTGSIPESLTLGVSSGVASTMPAGTSYSVVLTLTDSNDSSTATVTVNLTVLAPLTVCTGPISFTYQNGLTPSTQSCALSDTGSGHTYSTSVAPTSTWLTGVTASGNLNASLTLGISTVAASVLTAGSYSATITVTDSDGSVGTVVVNLTVVAPIGGSSGQASNSPVAFAFTKGTAAASQTVTVSDGASNTYTVGTLAYGGGATGWLTATATTNTTVDGTLTLGITASALASTPPGPYTATVGLTDSDGSITTVYVKVTVASPLSASSTATSLTYSQTFSGTQSAAQLLLTVSNSDASSDSYTVVKAGTCPAWFSATGNLSATSAASDTLTIKITSAAASLTLPVTPITTCTVQLQYQGVTFSTVTLTSLNVVGAGIATATTSVALTYTKVSGTTSPVAVSLTAPAAISGGVAFAASAGTVPAWLTLTPASGTAVSAGTSVSFAVNTAVAATMAVGNYTASVIFLAPPYTPLTIPVTFGISNVGATLSLKESTLATLGVISGIYTVGTTQPAPLVTPYSSDEPLPFTASCVVGVVNSSYTPTNSSCLLNATTATVATPLVAVAYTWGYPLTATLDSALFALPVGTIVNVTVTITPTGGANSGTPISLEYSYTTEMAAPTLPTTGAVVPTSVAPQTVVNTSVAVLLTGTNFIGPQSIVGGVVSPTLVYLGGSTTAVPQTQVTVVSTTQMLVTIPQASFPTVTTGKTNLAIGLANQTGSAAPTAATITTNLVVTTAPVVYAVTSTASYNNGGLGSTPNLAPFELVSIFGDNFGYSALTPNFATATVNAQDQVPTSLLISGTGTHALDLSVTFKDSTPHTPVSYSAPILFANQNQINALVPSGLIVGDNVTVSVTSGASTNVSDGLYTIKVAGYDPGIFTVASDGTGPGAILNVASVSPYAETVNSSSNPATAGQTVAIFMTGLGVPDSTHPDVNLATPDTTPFPTDCSAVSLTASATIPGYLQVANTAKGATAIAGWTAPTTVWTNIDGAVIQGELFKTNILPPCMVDPITVTFGSGGTAKTATTAGGTVTWAGFASSSIAGLYQINVVVPSGVTTGASVPVTVTITPASTGYSTQAGVTMAIQ